MALQAPGFAVPNFYVRDLEEIRYAGRFQYWFNFIELTFISDRFCLDYYRSNYVLVPKKWKDLIKLRSPAVIRAITFPKNIAQLHETVRTSILTLRC